jgi:uncharacterized protein YqjF (DUF2071 family)
VFGLSGVFRRSGVPGVFLTAEWRALLIVSFEIDPARLEPFVPRGTTLDAWEGRTLVSLVGFRFLYSRVRGIRAPCHQDFPEVNLRFYVRRETAGESRRGVVFIRELVPGRLVAWLARSVYGENYLAVPMRWRDDPLAYEWRGPGGWCALSARPHGPATIPAVGSQEEFVAEHYWGYVGGRGRDTVEYRVEHARWSVRRAADPAVTGPLAEIYPASIVETISRPPLSAFIAAGSPVTVHRGIPLSAHR